MRDIDANRKAITLAFLYRYLKAQGQNDITECLNIVDDFPTKSHIWNFVENTEFSYFEEEKGKSSKTLKREYLVQSAKNKTKEKTESKW